MAYLGKRIMVLAAALMLLAACWSPASAGPVLDRITRSGELRVGLTPTFPPLEVKAKDGSVIGFDVDLSQDIAQSMGVKLKLVEMEFKDLLPALHAGKLDLVISGLTITPTRNLKSVFVGPYLVAGQTVLIKAKTAAKVQAVTDLNDAQFTVAVARHTTAETAVRQVLPKAKLLATEGEEQALKALIEGQAQALVADMPFCSVMAFRHRAMGILHLDTPFTFEPLGIALPSGDPELVNWLGNFLLLMKGSGRLDALGDKWFRDSAWMSQLP